MSETIDENQPQSRVKGYDEIQTIVDSFYETLPGRAIGSFKRQEKTPEQLEAFKEVIDEAQAIFDEFKVLRLERMDSYTEEELADMKKPRLQKIAMSFGMAPDSTAPKLRDALKGLPKSYPAVRAKYWRKTDKLGLDKGSALIAHLREAREAYHAASGEEYLHPLQTEAQG